MGARFGCPLPAARACCFAAAPLPPDAVSPDGSLRRIAVPLARAKSPARESLAQVCSLPIFRPLPLPLDWPPAKRKLRDKISCLSRDEAVVVVATVVAGCNAADDWNGSGVDRVDPPPPSDWVAPPDETLVVRVIGSLPAASPPSLLWPFDDGYFSASLWCVLWCLCRDV